MEWIIVALIAFFTSLVSGMLGLGGAVLLIPAYLYLPNLFNVHVLDVKSISGMTTVQVFGASLMGMLLHRRKGAVNTQLVWIMGIPIAFSSFAGAMFSGSVKPDIILSIFALMAVIGAVMMLIQKSGTENIPDDKIKFSKSGAVTIAITVGFFGGMVGAPGAFILSPLMMVVLKVPTRITIGSTLGIVLLSSFSASVGKIITGQVPLMLSLIAVLASLPGVYLGSQVSHRLKIRTLRWILAILIAAVGVQMWYTILS